MDSSRASTFRTRILFGVGLLALLVGSALADIATGHAILITAVLALLLAVGTRELCSMARKRNARPLDVLAIVASVGLVALRCAFRETGTAYDAASLPALFAVGLLFAALVCRLAAAREALAPGASDILADAGVTLAAFVYLGLGLGMLQEIWYLATDIRKGILLVLAVVLVSKAADIGGYLTGFFLGKTKLAPVVSPGKTIEGAIGGALLSVVASCLLFLGLEGLKGVFSLAGAVVFGLVINVLTQLGDLLESLLKRSAGTKDAGNLIPTFGGVLDLVDSLTFAAPAAYVILRTVVTSP